jgi:DeoR family transcriptional regulator, suf operon transcriptional repressor
MDAIGLLGETKRRILEELQHQPSTAQALAGKFDVQTSAVRGHLDALETQGLVKATFKRAGVGRPRKVYELTDAGQEVFPRRYHLLLTRIVEHLAEKEGRAYTARLLAEVAQDIASDLRVPAQGTVEQRAFALAQALNTLGFDAALEQTAQGLVLVRRNCIFLESAKEHHDLVCGRFDQELVKAAFGTGEASLQCCMATGSNACHNLLTIAPGPPVPHVHPPAGQGQGEAPGGSPS